MTGLEEIQAMIALGRRPPMMELLDIDLVEVEKGRVVFAATPAERLYNPMSIVHGGFAATMLDSACGLAAHSMAETVKNCVTLELKVAYHRAMDRHTGPVQAIGQILSMGSRVAHTEARLVGVDGQLYASATSTLLLSERIAAGA